MAFKLENIPKEAKLMQPGGQSLLKREIHLFGNSFGNKKKQAFYLELNVLLRAGITLKEALQLILQSVKKEADRKLFDGLLRQVISGRPFSEALLQSGKFSEYEYFSVKIGEETGTTAQVCQELGKFYERKNEQQRIVIAALTYPAIVLSTAAVVVFFMLSYVVPMFEGIFKQNNMELPLLTRVIISASGVVRQYGLFCAAGLVGFIIALYLLKDNYSYRKYLHTIALKIPVLGNFMLKVYIAQFTQAVALLSASKVPMLNSIQMVGKMIRFVPLQEALTKVEAGILKGQSLSSSLAESPLFDRRILSLVKVAEETNQTEYVFKQLNEQYSHEVTQQSKVMATVLEPFIILIVGVLVAILLIAMYLPMFQLSTAVG
ncbi:type II secretion system F family protein [Nodularia spumigena CS-584]|nr:type II secretion system F family protein [Nodularia spumigena CS-584]